MYLLQYLESVGVLQTWRPQVLFGKPHEGRGERRGNADRRIVEPDRSIMLARIGIGDLVGDLGVRLQRHKAMGEAFGNEDLVAFAGRNPKRGPMPETRGT